MSNPLKNRGVIYDKLHRFGILSIFGVSFAALGLLGYNIYLFKSGNHLRFNHDLCLNQVGTELSR